MALTTSRQNSSPYADLHVKPYAQRHVKVYADSGFTEETAHTLACLGFVEELRGALDAAEAFHRKSLLVTRELFDELPRAFALEGLACVAAARQQPQRAAVLLGAAESIHQRAGTPPPRRSGSTSIGRPTPRSAPSVGRPSPGRLNRAGE
jgi:hypothetical protein